MEPSALILMIVVQVSVACITGYFFYKVLTVKPKKEESEN
ncbi:MAG: hypothetical protein ACJATA_001699 [Sphingobacteriales bacterium]|jgi:hypothetical protein